MNEFRVEADVYNLTPWGRGFTFDRIEFSRLPSYNFEKDYQRGDKEHLLTTTASATIAASDCGEAIKKLEVRLNPLCLLLSFAQNRHVFYEGFRCAAKPEESANFYGTYGGRVGRARGPCIVHEWCTAKFLESAYPLIDDSSYARATGIGRALLWYWEAELFRAAQAVELQFPSFWIILEILGNANASSLGFDTILEDGLAKKMIADFRKIVDGYSVETEKRERLFAAIGNFNREQTRRKIEMLLGSHGLQKFQPEIKTFYRMRNDIFHARDLEKAEYDPIEISLRVRRLVEMLILKILKFYDPECIHSAYFSDNLRAVE